MASNSGVTEPHDHVTAAVTCRSSRSTSALFNTAALRRLQQFCHFIHMAVPELVHPMRMLTLAKYAYNATNVQLQRWE